MTRLGAWAYGPCKEVAAQSNYIYFGNGGYLETASINSAGVPTLLGRLLLPAAPEGLCVAGGYLYIAAGEAGLLVVDISNPSNPNLVGTCGGFSAFDVAINGSFAYVAAGQAFCVVNVANPLAPTRVGTLTAVTYCSGVAASGSYAYLADWDAGLRIINVSNPQSPVQAGIFNTPGMAVNVAVSGSYAYVADQDYGLRIINISNPAAPYQRGSFTSDCLANDVVISGTYAYVADHYTGLRVISVSNPAAPSQVGYMYTTSNAFGIAATSGRVYIAAYWAGVRVVSVQTPTAPVETGFLAVGGYVEGVTIAGSMAFVADRIKGLCIIDLSNPSAPVAIGQAHSYWSGYDVRVDGQYAYLADFGSGLTVFDIGNPRAPVIVGNVDTPGGALAVAKQGNIVYVADQSSGLRIISVSNVRAPQEIGSVDTPGMAQDVVVDGECAFIADNTGGVRIIDVATPSAPRELSYYPVPGWTRGIAVMGDYAFAASSNGFFVLDVSNRNAPTLVGSNTSVHSCTKVALGGRYAYVGVGYDGVAVIDVTSPGAPARVGYYVTGGYGEDVAVSGNTVCVADQEDGLQVLRSDVEAWPGCAAAPCIRVRVEEAVPGSVHSARLSADLPRTEKTATAVDVENGFVLFDDSAIASAIGILNGIDKIELLDAASPPNLVGHIGFKYSYSQYTQHESCDAYVFVHNDRPRMNISHPEWAYHEDGWTYFADGEYPVTLLVPPRRSIASALGGGKQPILFVHGVSGYYSYFGAMPDSLGTNNFESWQFGYPYDAPIDSCGGLLGEAIERLVGPAGLYGFGGYTNTRVNIVAHSMGGLVARSYIQKSEANAGRVRKLAMLATPNHGSHVSYRLFHCGEGSVASIGEPFVTHDPQAPAHMQMTPASEFMFALNSSAPRRLGASALSSDYLVIAGIRNTGADLVHQEIWHQDDDVVAVSSASLVDMGIPLAVVKESHRGILGAEEAPANVRKFLAENYNPGAPGFTDWVACRMNSLPSSACSDVDGLDTRGGILELKINGGAGDARHYQIERGDQDFLDFKPNAFIDWKDSITRVGDSGNHYFSTNTKSINEIKWVDIPDGTYRGRLMEKRWVRLWPRWVPIGVSEPFSYTSMRTTMATLNFSTVTNAIAGATNGTALVPLVGLSKALTQYAYPTDASVDTLIVSLSSPAGMGDYAQHGFSLEGPGGIVIDPAYAESAPNVEFEDGGPAGYAQYLIANPEPGTWSPRHSDSVQDPLVYVFLKTQLSAQLSLARDGYVIGDTLACLASFTGVEQCSETQLSLSGYFVAPDSSIAQSIGTVALEEVSPGQYRGFVPGAAEGEYTFTLRAQCTGARGEVIDRETSKAVLVSRPTNELTGVDPGEGAPPPARLPLGISAVAPNPFNPRAVVSWWLARPDRVHLAVYDVSGRRLATVFEGSAEAGEHAHVWSGQDDQGRRLPSGVYFVRLATATEYQVRKIAILK